MIMSSFLFASLFLTCMKRVGLCRDCSVVVFPASSFVYDLSLLPQGDPVWVTGH